MADYSGILEPVVTAGNWGTTTGGTESENPAFDWGGLLKNLIPAGVDIGLYAKQLSDLDRQRGNVSTQIQDLTDAATNAADFKGYTVTSNLGQSDVDSSGNITMSGDPRLEQFGDALRYTSSGLLKQAAMDPTKRENMVYEDILAAMQPQRERDKQALDASLWNTGRGGVSSAAYGGSPEQLAYFKAIEEANLGSNVAAKEFAMKEQDALYNRGKGMFDLSFTPNEQLRKDLGYGINTSQITQTANQAEADLLAQLGLGGLGTELNYANISSGLTGDMYRTISDAVRGGTSSGSGLFGDLIDYGSDWLQETFG